MSIIACYFIAKTLLLWEPRDIVQIAYYLRQKSPLHFATSHNTLQQSQLHTLSINQSVSLIADLRPKGRIANEMQVK